MVTLSRETIIAGLQAAARIRSGAIPTDAEIDAAPRLDAWGLEPVGDGMHRLVGLVSGHPTIANGFCRTSVVLILADDVTWARTVSRIYALKAPIGELLKRAETDG